MGGWGNITAIIGAGVLFVGLFLICGQVQTANKYNKVVGIAKSQNRITMKEMGLKSGVPEA